MNSLVSIIVPMYNAKNTIKKCLKSLLNQTYDNIEIIVINDGSTDGCQKIVEKFIKNDNRITIINQNNSGSSIARKTGLKNISSKSKFFLFCDADDCVHRDYVKILIEYQKKYDADIVQCSYYKTILNHKYNDYNAECLNQLNVYDKKQIMDSLYISYFGITDFPGYLHTKLYKKYFANLILSFPTIVDFMAEDLSVNIRILPYCQKIVTIPDKLYYYSYGGGTSKYMPNFMSDFCAYHKLQLDLINEYNLEEKFLYYSNIEIINVFHTWLNMCFIHKNFDKQDMIDEIKNWLDSGLKDEIIYLENKWDNRFFFLLSHDQYGLLYDFLYKESHKIKHKILLKKLIGYLQKGYNYFS